MSSVRPAESWAWQNAVDVSDHELLAEGQAGDLQQRTEASSSLMVNNNSETGGSKWYSPQLEDRFRLRRNVLESCVQRRSPIRPRPFQRDDSLVLDGEVACIVKLRHDGGKDPKR
jgi:hypothetical protein